MGCGARSRPAKAGPAPSSGVVGDLCATQNCNCPRGISAPRPQTIDRVDPSFEAMSCSAARGGRTLMCGTLNDDAGSRVTPRFSLNPLHLGGFKQFPEERSIGDHGPTQLFGGHMDVSLARHYFVSRTIVF